MKALRIGTRGSALALAQVNLVMAACRRVHPALEVEIVQITTRGDERQGSKEEKVADKKEWIFEIEQALVQRRIDLAVHSGKDVPAEIESGTIVVPVLDREDPFDVFIGKDGVDWKNIPPRARIGTSSARRKAELLALRNDLTIVEHRGNVQTRITKLQSNRELSGIVLAGAGLRRLGIASDNYRRFSLTEMVPAVNQGILVVQFLKDRADILSLLTLFSASALQAVFAAERACVEKLGADCRSSVGVYASVTNNKLELRARVLSADGKEVIENSGSGSVAESEELGKKLAMDLLSRGAAKLL